MVDWNVLPHHLIELQSIDLFVVGVCMYLILLYLCIVFFLGLVPLDKSVIHWLSNIIKIK